MMSMKKIKLLSATIILILISATPEISAKPKNVGLVQINNATEFQLSILVQKVDRYGYISWEPIGTIPPYSFTEISNIPDGVLLGARSENGEISWASFKVEFDSKVRIFEYTLRPIPSAP